MFAFFYSHSNDKVSAPRKNAGNAVTMANRRNRAVAVSLATHATIELTHGQLNRRRKIIYKQLTKKDRFQIYEGLNRNESLSEIGRAIGKDRSKRHENILFLSTVFATASMVSGICPSI